MKHEFTQEQINTAILEARALKSHSVVSAWNYAMFSQFLDALPEPVPVADEWEECKNDEIQPDEHFLVKLDGWTFEGRRGRSYDLVIKLPGVNEYIDTSFIAQLAGNTKTERARFYRIPAPVQHPDPAVFSVIYVKDCDVVNFIPKIMVWFRNAYVAGHHCLTPERITDWEPVKFDPEAA